MKFRFASFVATLALALLLNGCAPIDSIFPLYKADDAVSDDRLLGTWQPVGTNSDGSVKDQRWNFVHSKDDEFYDFNLGVVGARGGFAGKVRLVRLGDSLFIDFHGDMDRTMSSDKPDDIIPYPAIATHMIGRVWLEKDSLRIHFLNDDWIKKQVKAGALSLAHLDTNDGQILTASTEDLRKFMQAHADDADALSENYELRRFK
jgi:hypothetical protein